MASEKRRRPAGNRTARGNELLGGGLDRDATLSLLDLQAQRLVQRFSLTITHARLVAERAFAVEAPR